MGVRVVERTYLDRFSQDQTDWLLGNVGDWQKAVFTVDASVDFFASLRQPILIDELNNIFEINSGTWGELGFDNGQQITFQYKLETDPDNDGNYNSETITQLLDIENIFGNKMQVRQTINTSDFTQMPLNLGNRRTVDVTIFVTAVPEGVKMQYTHLTNENRSSQVLSSVIDRTVTEFIAPELSDSVNGSWVDMQPTGNQSGMSIRNARVRRLFSNNNESFATLNVIPASNILQSRNYDNFNFRRNLFQSAKCIPLTVVGSQASFIQSVPEARNIRVNENNGGPPTQYGRGIKETCFIFNAPEDSNREISINLQFRIPRVARITAGQNRAELVLYTYSGGEDMDYDGRQVLNTWQNVETLINQDISYSNVVPLTIEEENSYALVLEFLQNSYQTNFEHFMAFNITQGVIEVSQADQTFTSGSKNRYQFELEYMISSFFDTPENIATRTIPNYLLNDGSLTDNFRFTFFPEWNNPNVSITNNLQETERLGNTGWFDENYNQFKNNFTIDSVQYFDIDGNTVNAIDYVSKTVARIKVSGVPNLNNNTRCGIGFAWIPTDEEAYTELETPFYQNLFVQSGDTSQGFQINTSYVGPYIGAGTNGGSMNVENINITTENDVLVLNMTFSPNPAFQTIFENKDQDDRNYLLYISVADGELQRRYSDRVTLIADYRLLIKTIAPAGPYPFIENVFLQHAEDENALGNQRLNAIVQDDILARLPFRVRKNTGNTFNSITFGVEMFNASTNQSFDLESYSVDLSNSQRNDNQVQQFAVNETRGFRLPVNNNKNLVRIEKSSETLDFEAFIAYFAFRIRWEDWQTNPNAPQEFFNSDLLNNGLNNDWFEYVQKQGWQINFFTRLNVTENEEVLLYKNTWEFRIQDYDSNSLVTTTHNYFRNSDNTNINVGTDPETGRPLGVILANEETRIEIAHTITDTGTFVLANYYGIITIEIDRGQGQFEMRELTTVWDRESDNPLKGITNEARLDMEISTNQKTLTTKCIVDPNLLQNAVRYRITGRIGCLPDGSQFTTGLYATQYENLYE